MNPIVTAITTLLLVVDGASDVQKATAPMRYSDVEGMLKDPSSVVDTFLEGHKPTVAGTRRIRVPKSSPSPRFDLEVSLWKHDIPGLTILTTKTIKGPVKEREGKLLLSYLSVDVDTYSEYLRLRGEAAEGFLVMTPAKARHMFPNIEEDTVNAAGTGCLGQYLWEHGDDPMAFVQMRFLEGRLKKVAFGRDSEWVQQLLKAKASIPENGDSEQAGADQPATRSESKSDGGDKPQPESEARPR